MPQPVTRIFLFEDEHYFPSTLQKALVEDGHEVFAFSTPALCAHAPAEQCVCPEGHFCTDVVIADVDLPRISGLDFVGRQKTRGCRCNNFAVISAKWSGDDLFLAEELGCRAFRKPVAFSDIAAWLGEVRGKIDTGRRLHDDFRELLPDNIAYKGGI